MLPATAYSIYLQLPSISGSCLLYLLCHCDRDSHNTLLHSTLLQNRVAQNTACRLYPARQCLFCGPLQPNDFIVIFLVWLLVTGINFLDSNISEAIQTLFHQNVKPNSVTGISVVFVHLFPEEGSENMRFIVNVSPFPASFVGHHQQAICPYVPLTIHAFSTALCGAYTVFLSFSVSLLVSCAVSAVAERKIDSE